MKVLLHSTLPCSPESAYYIDAYLQYRTKNGESLTKDSFLIREQFDITDLEQIRKGKDISIDGIESFLYIILRKSGVRSVNHNRDRKEVVLAHGFRKFFTTQCINSKLNPEIREMLLGHKIVDLYIYYSDFYSNLPLYQYFVFRCSLSFQSFRRNLYPILSSDILQY
jgi:integrase